MSSFKKISVTVNGLKKLNDTLMEIPAESDFVTLLNDLGNYLILLTVPRGKSWIRCFKPVPVSVPSYVKTD